MFCFESLEEEKRAMKNFVRTNPTAGSELMVFLYNNITEFEVMRERMQRENLPLEDMQTLYYKMLRDTPFSRWLMTRAFAAAALNEAFNGINAWRM